MDDGRSDSDININESRSNMSESVDYQITGHDDRWERVIDDMSTTATEYYNAGWETLELHPGDILPIPPEDGGNEISITSSDGTDYTPTTNDTTQDESEPHARIGLDIIIPDNEFSQLSDITSNKIFDEYESFRAERGDILFVVVAIKASADDTVVFVPLYYQSSDAQRMAQRAMTRGKISLFVRPLNNDRQVVFSQSNPELLLPAEFET